MSMLSGWADLTCDFELTIFIALPSLTSHPGTLGAMRAIAKAVDLGVSFIIGYASDATATSFGRRMPYIVVGSLVAPVSMWFLAAPPQQLNLNTATQAVTSDSSGFRPYDEVTPPPLHPNVSFFHSY